MFQVTHLVRFLASAVLIAIGSSAVQAAPILVSGTTSVTETVKYGGKTRTVLYIKPTTTSTAKVPLMVVLHFGGGAGDSMASLTEISEVVRDTGTWAMLPYGINGKFNHDPANSTGVDDVGFLANRIDAAIRSYPIASRKVYLSGYSNGGFMALRFACERPTMVAAVAVVTAQLRKSLPCNLSTSMPIAFINGTEDQIVEYNAQYGFLTAPATAEKFAGMNRCTSGARHSNLPNLVTSDNSHVTLDEYSGCTNGAKVALYSVVGGGHTWPGSPYNAPGMGAVNQDINGTLTAWEFVRQFSR